MSSYQRLTKHPKTQQWEVAHWLDDALGHHRYGVQFPGDDTMYDPEYEDLPTKESEVVLPPPDLEVEGDTSEFSKERLERLKEEANSIYKIVGESLKLIRNVHEKFYVDAQALVKKLDDIDSEYQLPRF